MAKRVQLRRGTTADHSTFVGALGEVTVDTEKKTLKVHDGATAGGIEVRTFAVSGDFYSQFVPLPYPQATPPSGYLAMMGQAISQATYPILYSLYGATLPDLRGVFIRGWDNGRGIDPGRVLLTYQADGFASHSHPTSIPQFYTSLKTGTAKGSYTLADTLANSNPRTGAEGGSETRPKNSAFNYIVKAG